MATLTTGYTFVSGDLVTPTKLNTPPVLTAGTIVNADISASAAIDNAKLAGAPTNASTANTIVLRDASGNFSAGAITANLTGNVTGNVTGTAGGALAGSTLARQVAKAFVTFTAPAALTGVAFAGSVGNTTITATKNNHNLNTGDSVTLFSQTGNNASLQGTWSITRVDANTFTFVITGTTYASYTTSTVYPVQIFQNYNIATVAPNTASSTGIYKVTFANGVTFNTYTTYAGATATTYPAYMVLGTVDSSSATTTFPYGIFTYSDAKSSTAFTCRAVGYNGTISVGTDYSAVNLVIYAN